MWFSCSTLRLATHVVFFLLTGILFCPRYSLRGCSLLKLIAQEKHRSRSIYFVMYVNSVTCWNAVPEWSKNPLALSDSITGFLLLSRSGCQNNFWSLSTSRYFDLITLFMISQLQFLFCCKVFFYYILVISIS